MSGWMPKGQRPAPALQGAAEATLSIEFKVDSSGAQREVQGLRAVYAAMPVARLRTVASKAGVTGSSRMRKGDVIDALMAQPLSLAHA